MGRIYQLLKGTSFRINKDAYERIKKAVVTLYMMSTKSENDIHLFANSMAGRHPLIGGTEITFKKDLFKKLIETGVISLVQVLMLNWLLNTITSLWKISIQESIKLM